MFLMFIVMCIIIIWAIRWAVKQERINEANEQADMERRRGEEILRARAERAAKERWETSEKARQATQNGKRFKVAGTSFREDALMSFAHKNPDYDMTTREIIEDGETNARIYRYDFDPVIATLEPEPDNPHDPKAIKVLFNGYISVISRPDPATPFTNYSVRIISQLSMGGSMEAHTK